MRMQRKKEMGEANQKALVHARVGDRNFEEILVVPFDGFIHSAAASIRLSLKGKLLRYTPCLNPHNRQVAAV